MSKKWTKILKLAFVITLFVIILNMSSNVYAAINTEYKVDSKVVDESLDDKAKSSILLDAIGNLIYVMASFGEWLIGVIFKAIASTGGTSGEMTFPWADAIVFNAVEVLDINFLNSADGSIIALIKGVITKIYGTIFGVAISFFSIAVLIMGIKIAISTIASDKAKYKQALWDWLLGLLLLFTIHIFISFVFYLNEELVKVASGIATTSLEEATYKNNIKINTANESAEANAQETMENFVDQMKNASWIDADFTSDFASPTWNVAERAKWRVNSDEWTKDSNGYYEYPYTGITGANDISKAELNKIDIEALKLLDSSFSNIDNVVSYLTSGEPAKVAAKLLVNAYYMKYRMPSIMPDEDAEDNEVGFFKGFVKQSDVKYLKLLCFDVYNIVNNNDLYSVLANMNDDHINSDQKNFGKLMVEMVKSHEEGEESMSSTSLIYNLASYFKTNSWGVAGGGGWGTTKVVLQNAIMYAILVVQSFIFLIAYIKRLFFVVILAMMAPAVVVYDFFNKTMS